MKKIMMAKTIRMDKDIWDSLKKEADQNVIGCTALVRQILTNYTRKIKVGGK